MSIDRSIYADIHRNDGRATEAHTLEHLNVCVSMCVYMHMGVSAQYIRKYTLYTDIHTRICIYRPIYIHADCVYI